MFKYILYLELLVLVLSSSINTIFTKRNMVPGTFGTGSSLVEGISIGAQIGMSSCKEMFKWNRWNCPETTYNRKYDHPATKEIAFARAIVAAGVAHTITKNCSQGVIEGCGCDTNYDGFISKYSTSEVESFNTSGVAVGAKVDWTWGGCSDSPEHGFQVAKNFLDDLDNDGGIKGLINLHNNEVGRKIVMDTMEKRCRCHGVSGSCTVQTCWMQVAPFEVIAKALKRKYHFAAKLEIQPDSTNTAAEEINLPKTNPNSLIYMEKSPDYCKTDEERGWKGTIGRACSKNKNATEYEEKMSCRNLCRTCGLRVRRQKKQVKKHCNCRFNWCCEVKCDVCVETLQEFYCT